MKIFVGAYKGKKWTSKAIKLETWGKFSHVALINEKGHSIESRLKGGVQFFKTLWDDHKKGTEVLLLSLQYPQEYHRQVWRRAEEKVGCKYDWRALAGFNFMTRFLWKDDPKKWFCSHQVTDDCNLNNNYQLFNNTVKTYKIDPSYCVSSSWLKPLRIIKNMDEFNKLMEEI